jgi:hypothetical protein
VDTPNSKLLFFSRSGNRHEGIFVDLYDIESVEVDKEYGLTFNNYSKKKIGETEVSKIALQLFYKNGPKRLLLPFYDRLEEGPTDSKVRSHQAREWRDILSSIAARDARTARTGKMPSSKSYLDGA